MNDPRITFYPVARCETFGYDVQIHSWTLDGKPISNDASLRILAEKVVCSENETSTQQDVSEVAK